MKSIILSMALIASLLSCDPADDPIEVDDTPTPTIFENCPAFDPSTPMLALYDRVVLHPDLMADTIEAVRGELQDARVAKKLGVGGAGEPVEILVSDSGTGDRLVSPRYKLADGRELYVSIGLNGGAKFEDGSHVDFVVWASPLPAGRAGCYVQGVAIQPVMRPGR